MEMIVTGDLPVLWPLVREWWPPLWKRPLWPCWWHRELVVVPWPWPCLLPQSEVMAVVLPTLPSTHVEVASDREDLLLAVNELGGFFDVIWNAWLLAVGESRSCIHVVEHVFWRFQRFWRVGSLFGSGVHVACHHGIERDVVDAWHASCCLRCGCKW